MEGEGKEEQGRRGRIGQGHIICHDVCRQRWQRRCLTFRRAANALVSAVPKPAT